MNEIQNMQPVEAQPTPVAAPSHGGKKLLLSIVGLVVVIGGFAAYTMFANPFAGKTPEQILAKAVSKSLEAESHSKFSDAQNVAADMSIHISGTVNDSGMEEPVTLDLTIPFTTLSEMVSETDYKVAVKLNDLDIANIFTAVGFPVTEPQIVAAEMRLFSADKKGYFQVTSLPAFFGLLLGDTSQFMNKWLSFDFEDVEGTPATFNFNTLSKEQKKQIQDAIVSNLSEMSDTEVSMETVGSGRLITYKTTMKEIEAYFIRTAKDVNEIAGQEIITAESLMPTNPMGNVTLTIMVERDLTASNLKVDIDGVEGGVSMNMEFKTIGQDTFAFDIKISEPLRSDVLIHIDISYKDGGEKVDMSGYLKDDVVDFKFDLTSTAEEYEGSRIEIPSGATPLEDFAEQL